MDLQNHKFISHMFPEMQKNAPGLYETPDRTRAYMDPLLDVEFTLARKKEKDMCVVRSIASHHLIISPSHHLTTISQSHHYFTISSSHHLIACLTLFAIRSYTSFIFSHFPTHLTPSKNLLIPPSPLHLFARTRK